MSGLLKILVVLFAAFLLIDVVSGLNAKYGNDFYIGSMRNFGGNTNSYKFHLASLQTTPSVSYSIENYNGVVILSGTLDENGKAVVNVPVSYVTNTNAYSERFEGLHLTSTGPITVLVVNHQTATIGEYPAYPKQEYSLYQYEYFTAAPTTSLVTYARSEILLVGTDDGTTVTITPRASISVPFDIQQASSPQVTLTAGETKQITLNKLQTFFIGVTGGTATDLTGTAIVSDKPLTVISGHECANIPSSQTYCEHVEEQIPPTVTWGTEFLIRTYSGKTDHTYFLIVSSEDDTVIKHNCGGTVVSLSLAFAGDKTTMSSTVNSRCYMEATKPILITQMMTGGSGGGTGDPAVSVLPPTRQYTNEVVFHTPNLDQTFEQNHINIVMKQKDTITMDGSDMTDDWETISDFNGGIAGYSRTVSGLSVDVHTIKSKGGLPFHVVVYGYTSNLLAGYTFGAGIGLQEQLVGGKLQVKPWYGNILGGIPFLLKGPRLTPSDVVTCQMNEVLLSCERVDDEHAMCVSPRFTSTRRITLRMFKNGEKYASEAKFYSLPIEEDHSVSVAFSNFFLKSGDVVPFHWNPQSVIPSETGVNTANLRVNVTLYKIVEGTDSTIEKIAQVASNLPNTGLESVTIPVAESDEIIDFCVFSLTFYDSVDQQTIISSVNSSIHQWCTDTWITFYDPNEIDDLFFSKCNEWAANETAAFPNIKQQLEARVRSTPCPPTRAQVRTPNSGLVKDSRSDLVKFLHPEAEDCYRQRAVTTSNQLAGNECCYSSSGNLIVGLPSGGSINKIDPYAVDLIGDYWLTHRMHFKEDIVPWLLCCKLAKKNCQAYYDRRPSDDGSNYRPPVPACVYGDPHIVTLDLLKYTFNGRGEFILVETPDFEPSFTLHARMVPVKDKDHNDGKATVFSAIVAKQGDSDAVQFELQNRDDGIKIITYIDGEEIDFSELTVQEFNNITVSDTGNNTLNAIFPTGAYITVAESNGLISTLVVYLPDMYRGNTQGLMGNYNNDTEDDLLRKGTTLPIATDSPLSLIHNYFGLSYMIYNESDGLFTYNDGDSFAFHHDPGFIPIFEVTFTNSTLEAIANDICNGDQFCLFDIAVSGVVEIGMSTKQGSDDFEMLQELSLPIVCEPPCEYGACVDTNVCSCSEGYIGTTCDTMNATDCSSFNPCQNGAECGEIGGTVFCTCLYGYIGYYCENIDPINPPTTSTAPPVQTTTNTRIVSSSTTTNQQTTRDGGTTSSSTTSTVRPSNERSEGLPVSTNVIIVIAVIIGIIVMVGIVMLIIVVVIVKKRNTQKMTPREHELTSEGIGKSNPAYYEFNENEDNVYDEVNNDDKKRMIQ